MNYNIDDCIYIIDIDFIDIFTVYGGEVGYIYTSNNTIHLYPNNILNNMINGATVDDESLTLIKKRVTLNEL